ncbi:MAG: mannosyltransferase [Actinobacteria bacterium]|nr:mannosyltransferase [Actinomycetota bacterium]
MLTKKVSKVFILIVLLVSLLSLLKFNYCRATNWASPGNYVHACYTDIPALFSERDLDTNTFPYQSSYNSMEYPPIIGLGNWLISFITPQQDSHRWFFDINAFVIIILFLISALIVRKIKPEFSYLYPVAPAVAASLFINWDLWATVTALAAIYLFDKKKYEASSIWLGISIATKFFPIVFLLPIAIIFYKQRSLKDFYLYFFKSILIAAAFNLPLAVLYFDGWWRFFRLNLNRADDFGSIWYAANLLGFKLPAINYLYTIITILLFIALGFFLIKLPMTPKLAQVAFFAVVVFTTTSKVYSPQYVLWLTPLAVIALTKSTQQITFWLWQATEIIYHLAIWQYLAGYSGATFGLPAGAYAIASLLRVVGIITFTYLLLRDISAKSTVKKS